MEEDAGVVCSEFLAKGLAGRATELVELLPEAVAVVHVEGVGEFVKKDIVLEMAREKHQVHGEVDTFS